MRAPVLYLRGKLSQISVPPREKAQRGLLSLSNPASERCILICRRNGFLVLLVFLLSHQTSAVSRLIAVAETKLLRETSLFVDRRDRRRFCLILCASNSPPGATIAPSGSVITRLKHRRFVGLWTPPIRSVAIGPDGSVTPGAPSQPGSVVLNSLGGTIAPDGTVCRRVHHPVHFGDLQLCFSELACTGSSLRRTNYQAAKQSCQRKDVLHFHRSP